jgi:hypothetical protein
VIGVTRANGSRGFQTALSFVRGDGVLSSVRRAGRFPADLIRLSHLGKDHRTRNRTCSGDNNLTEQA